MRLLTHIRTFNTRWVIWALAIVVIATNLISGGWKEGIVIRGEIENHYRVLPALFYEGSLCEKFDTPADTELVPVGVAASYLPFFALAHLTAWITGQACDGYSAPYQFFVLFSSLVYFVIGLIFLAKLLRLHFPGLVCSVTLLAVSFGTNAFYYLTTGGGMPHALSFMLVVLFIYQVIAWHQLRDYSSAVQLGLLLGALCLVRPVNGWLVIVFFLYDVRRFTELPRQATLFARRAAHLLTVGACFAAVMVPQLLYWKCVSGALLPDGPFDTSGFHFKRPHILQGFFSFHHGWLIHTPMMLIGVSGIFFLRGALRMYAWAIPVFLIVYTFVVFSWWCWWHGASFGQRALIDIYPLMAIPFGAFVYKLRRLGGVYKHALYLVIIVLIAVNIWMTFRIAPPPEGEGTCVSARSVALR